VKHSLIINRTRLEVDVDPDTPLLWVLRDHLALLGTKFGCGIGQCGACTVQLAGVATRSCVLSVAAVTGQPVTTIEGVGATDLGRRIQAAWLEHDVPQCGYCQGGQILAAEALLRKHSHPTEQQITDAMAGNYCRCGTYLRIRAAIAAVARRSPPHLRTGHESTGA
jgi:isoquinoline 1-oxidoreductase alpha subunit